MFPPTFISAYPLWWVFGVCPHDGCRRNTLTSPGSKNSPVWTFACGRVYACTWELDESRATGHPRSYFRRCSAQRHVRSCRHGTCRVTCLSGSGSAIVSAPTLSPSPPLTGMRLCSLCGVLLLLCLYAVPGLAAGGQTVSIRRAHQPRKVDQIIRTHLRSVTTSLRDAMTPHRYERPIVGSDDSTKESTSPETALRFENRRDTPDHRPSQATNQSQHVLSPQVVRVQ